MIPSTVTAAPNAHSKSPMALFTISAAFVGLSNSSTGTRLGDFTSSRRPVSHAASKVPAAKIAHSRTRIARGRRVILVVVIASASIGQLEGEDERGKLRKLSLVDEIGRSREEHALRVETRVRSPRVQIPAGDAQRERARGQ